MPLRGETSKIPLNNILQALSLGHQKGTLKVSWSRNTRRFRCFEGRLRVLPDEPGHADPLLEALIKKRILTEERFNDIRNDLTGELPLGDALFEAGILTMDQVTGSVQSHFREVIFSVLPLRNAGFHFDVDEEPENHDGFFSPGISDGVLSFDAMSILMEAARREDEWKRINGIVPHPQEMLVPCDPDSFEEAVREHTESEQLAEDLLKLLDGRRSLKAVAAKSSGSEFVVFSVAAELLKKGVVESQPPDRKKAIALNYERQSRIEEAADAYRSLVASDPDDIRSRKAKKQIARLESSLYRQGSREAEKQKRSKRDVRRFLLKLAARASCALFLVAVVFLLANEISGFHRCAEAQEKVNELLEEEKFDKAEEHVERIQSSFPSLLVRLKCERMHMRIRESARRRAKRSVEELEERRYVYGERLGRAALLVAEGNYEEALKLIESIPGEELSEDQKTELMRFNSKLKPYLQKAQSLASKARRAESGGRWRDAYLLWRRLLSKYPHSPEAERALLPLKVSTTPPGAGIWVNGEYRGSSPAVIRRPPYAAAALIVRKSSYAPHKEVLMPVPELQDPAWCVSIALQKVPAWKYRCRGPVEARPVCLGDLLVVADRSGLVYGLDRTEGKLRWKLEAGGIGGVSADLKRWKSRIVCLTNEGSLLVVSSEGNLVKRYKSRLSGPFKLPPQIEPQSGTVCFGTNRGGICAFSLESGSRLWALQMPGNLAFTPVIRDQRLVAADMEGNLWIVEAATGKKDYEQVLPGPTVPALFAEETADKAGTVLVGRERFYFPAYGSNSRIQYRRHSFGKPDTTCVAGKARLFFAAEDNYLCAVSLPDFALLWKTKLPATCGSIACTGDRIYAACGSQLLSFAASGHSVWRFSSPEHIWALGRCGESQLTAVSEDGFVYLFDLISGK